MSKQMRPTVLLEDLDRHIKAVIYNLDKSEATTEGYIRSLNLTARNT